FGSPQRAGLFAALALLVAIAVLYHDLIFGGKVFWAPDSMSAASLVTAGKNLMAREGYPLWNPYIFAGMPSFGSLVFVPYVYPVNFVLGIFVRYLFFPEYSWLLFHTFLTGVGIYLLLREHGARLAAALPAAILMMWMPNLVAVGANGHGSQACAVAYMPLALYFWDRLWRGRGLIANGAALALVLGLSMLRGHLQISYYTYGLIGLHAFWFGIARIVDGARGRSSEDSPLPPALRARLGAGASSLRAAITDVAGAWVVLALAVGLSVLMSAVLYLPVTDYAKHSIRGASLEGGLDYSYATMWSLHPAEMITFLVPHAFGFGKELYLGHMPFTDYPNYLGVVVFALALGAAIAVRSRWTRFLAAVWVIATLISFGNFFPVLYTPLFKLLPFFNKFRVPVMILIVQQIATIVLFGIGLDALLSAQRERAKTLATRVLAAAIVVLGLAVLSHGYFTGSGFATSAAPHVHATRDPDQQRMVAQMAGGFLARDLLQIGVIVLLAALAVFAFVRKNVGTAVFATLVLLLGAADYYRVDRFILHPEVFLHHDGYRILHDARETEHFKASDEMIDFLKKQEPPFRVLPVDGAQAQPPNDGTPPPISFDLQGLFSNNRFMVFDIGSVGGYHPAKLQDYEEFIRAMKFSMEQGRLDLASMMNARYIVSGVRLADHPALKPVWVGRDYNGEPRAIYENSQVFPPAWVAGAYRVEKPDEELAVMANGEVDLRHTVMLESKPSIEPEPGDSATVTVVKPEGAKGSAFHVTLDRPGILVVSEVYYKDWKATVDGKPAEMLHANHVLRAVALPAGEHEVVFRYDASLVKEGATVTVVTFALTLIACLVAALSRRGGARWNRSS
ncbi:MAG TPA: YfhO family protein, partial [Candidatus Krumholzibacteria bacterium]|nr:YfhO family protein [Candidatus Krumholzibacteria bacterium]